MTKLWYFEEDDGTVQQVSSEEKPHENAHEVDRFGDLRYEHYHPDKGWTIDPDKQADSVTAAHLADSRVNALSITYVSKALEALLMLSGYAVRGLVAQEAEIACKDPLDLAQEIWDNHTESIVKPELERIKQRRLCRGQEVKENENG